jgi:dihydroxyacetone kinase
VVGGTSGPLYAAGLLRASEALTENASWPDAFAGAVSAVMQLGGAAVGDRTMIDALAPAARAATDGLNAATEAARRGAESTAHQVARRGRSSYLGERVRGTPDPGAVAVTIWLEALRRAVGQIELR